MHVAFGRVRRKSRIDADYTDDADYRSGDGGVNCLNQDLQDWGIV